MKTEAEIREQINKLYKTIKKTHDIMVENHCMKIIRALAWVIGGDSNNNKGRKHTKMQNDIERNIKAIINLTNEKMLLSYKNESDYFNALNEISTTIKCLQYRYTLTTKIKNEIKTKLDYFIGFNGHNKNLTKMQYYTLTQIEDLLEDI